MERVVCLHCRGAPLSRIRHAASPVGYASFFPSRRPLKPRIPLPLTCQPRAFSAATFFRRPPPPSPFPPSFQSARRGFHGTTFILTAAVAAAAVPLVTQKSQDGGGNGESHETFEQVMLDSSEDEREEEAYGINKDQSLIYRTCRHVSIAFFRYIYEPIATGLRFVQLVFIFVPVIATIPVIFIGSRDEKHDSHRSGTLWWYAFLVRQMERAGPTFIKLGQWAASRTDIFPAELCTYMSKLHSNVKAHRLSATKRIVEATFEGVSFNDIWAEFDPTPLGVGAVAQVYKAKVNADLVPLSVLSGYPTSTFKTKASRIRDSISPLIKQSPAHIPSTHVAIKVLHPHVAKTIYRDIRIMRFFATLINAMPTMEWLSLPDEVDKFAEMMKLQLDLRIEGANLEIFQRNFAERSTVTFPSPYQEYTTRKVLIEEFAHGLPLPMFLELGAGPYNKELADMGLDAFLHMLLIDNFVHADLHPGNIMVRFYKSRTIDLRELIKILWSRPNHQNGNDPTNKVPMDPKVTEEAIARLRPLKSDTKAWTTELEKLEKEGFRPQLIFIDTGLVTELNDINRRNFLDLFRAVAEFNGYKAGHLMVERCRQPDAVLEPEIFALKMQHLVLGVKSKTFALGQIKFGDVLHEVLRMVRNHHVRLEGDFVNVVISILLLEGIGRQLNPDMDLFKSAIPILREVGAQRAREAIASGEAGDLGVSGAWLKVWVGLETRNLITASVQEIERLVKYDGLSPNI